MKKIYKFAALALTLAMALGLMVGPAAAASDEKPTRASTVKVIVNDALVVFPDVQPFIDGNGRTLVPIRFMTEAMGANVSWEQETHTAVIEKDGITVRATYHSKDLVVIKNGKESIVTMDTEVVGKDSRTCVPVRYICEALGAYVDYSNLYNVAEIVTCDELTAEDIERLRSYDRAQCQWWHTDRPDDQWFVNKTEYKYFDGQYGFSNSHNYLLLSPDNARLAYKAYSSFTEAECVEDTNSYDFMTFALKYVNDLLELEKFALSEDTGKEKYVGGWTYHKAGWLDVTYNFRSCTNLIYQQICPPHGALSIRGIMDVTFGEDTPKQWITDSFGIEDPEYGRTYSLDVEFDVVVNNYHHMDEAYIYYFTEDGVAHELDLKPVVNYHN